MGTALITGASSGIGEALADVFAANGHNLVLVARREDRLQQVKDKLESENNVKIFCYPQDLVQPYAAQACYDFCKKENIEIDFIVNNAGFGDFGLFQKRDWEKQQNMVQLNIVVLMHLTHLFLPELTARNKGGVLNVASTAAFVPGPFMSVYYATKAFVLSFTEALSNELKDTQLKVSCLCPGGTESEFQEKANLQRSSLGNGRKLPTSLSVARFGYQAFIQNKTVAIPGVANKALAQLPRILPRKIATSIVRSIQEEKDSSR